MANVKKIISGGQTGVDRAALDVALKLRIPCGGWCPKGRLAEDGPIPERYPLKETPSAHYPERTEWNVRDTDGTLILTLGKLDGGTALTANFALDQGKPILILYLETWITSKGFLKWLQEGKIQVLNVAGPRESSRPGIYQRAKKALEILFRPRRHRQ